MAVDDAAINKFLCEKALGWHIVESRIGLPATDENGRPYSSRILDFFNSWDAFVQLLEALEKHGVHYPDIRRALALAAARVYGMDGV